MKALITLIIVIYDAFLLAGTAYLIEERGWSMWTFALTVLFFLTSKDNPPQEKKLSAEDILTCKNC